MLLLRVAFVACFIVVLVQHVECSPDKSQNRRKGGKKRSSSGREPLPKRIQKQSTSGYRDEELDVWGEEAPVRRRKRRDMVAMQRRGQFQSSIPQSMSSMAAILKKNFATATEKIGHVKDVAASQGRRLQREVKLYTSGTWESALLKATWPDDSFPNPELVNQIVQGVGQFRRDMDVTRNSAEHRIFLRKLWAKMSEPDWRTKIKSLYILHRVLRELPPQEFVVLKRHMEKIKREASSKGRSADGVVRYFDLEALVRDIGPPGPEVEDFRGYVERYASYVFKRCKEFSSSFEELRALKPGIGIDYKHVIVILVKTRKVLDAGLACKVETSEESQLTLLALSLVALDVHKLFTLFHGRLKWVLQEAEAKEDGIFAQTDQAELEKCMADFKQFYISRRRQVKKFLRETEDTLRIFDFRWGALSLPPAHKFDSPPVEEDNVKAPIIETQAEPEIEVASFDSKISSKSSDSQVVVDEEIAAVEPVVEEEAELDGTTSPE